MLHPQVDIETFQGHMFYIYLYIVTCNHYCVQNAILLYLETIMILVTTERKYYETLDFPSFKDPSLKAFRVILISSSRHFLMNLMLA